MKYIDHEGKERRVSDERFQKLVNSWINEPTWLEFRMKELGLPKEELIINPQSYVIVIGKNGVYGGLRACGINVDKKHPGKFYGGTFNQYGPGPKIRKYFDTPEEAYDYAYNLDLGIQK